MSSTTKPIKFSNNSFNNKDEFQVNNTAVIKKMFLTFRHYIFTKALTTICLKEFQFYQEQLNG